VALLFDHDPVTGVQTYYDYDPIQDKIHLTYVQDVKKILDEIKEKRITRQVQKNQVEEFAHYATIPAIVEMQLLKKGLKLSDKNATKKIIQEIESNFPYCKVTDKKHGVK
jgi:hypothetical protein